MSGLLLRECTSRLRLSLQGLFQLFHLSAPSPLSVHLPGSRPCGGGGGGASLPAPPGQAPAPLPPVPGAGLLTSTTTTGTGPFSRPLHQLLTRSAASVKDAATSSRLVEEVTSLQKEASDACRSTGRVTACTATKRLSRHRERSSQPALWRGTSAKQAAGRRG